MLANNLHLFTLIIKNVCYYSRNKIDFGSDTVKLKVLLNLHLVRRNMDYFPPSIRCGAKENIFFTY